MLFFPNPPTTTTCDCPSGRRWGIPGKIGCRGKIEYGKETGFGWSMDICKTLGHCEGWTGMEIEESTQAGRLERRDGELDCHRL